MTETTQEQLRERARVIETKRLNRALVELVDVVTQAKALPTTKEGIRTLIQLAAGIEQTLQDAKPWLAEAASAAATPAAPAKTLAERFCEMDPDLAGAMADADEAKWHLAMDDSAELTFSDGSVASCLNGGPWEARPLRDPTTLACGELVGPVTRDEDLGQTDRLYGPDEHREFVRHLNAAIARGETPRTLPEVG